MWLRQTSAPWRLSVRRPSLFSSSISSIDDSDASLELDRESSHMDVRVGCELNSESSHTKRRNTTIEKRRMRNERKKRLKKKSRAVVKHPKHELKEAHCKVEKDAK